MRLASLLLAFALAASGQVTPAVPAASNAVKADDSGAQKPPEKGHITGKVTNEVTGEPLKKVTVEAYSTEGQDSASITTMTDASGLFHIDEMEPGKYTLHASRNGYVRRSYGDTSGRGNGTVLSIGPGGTVEANFKLTPQSVVTGRIVDEDGEPLANVQLSLSRYQWINGKRMLTPGGGATTNDLGEYRLFGISPGKYFLSATYNPNQFSFGKTTSDTPDVDYPSIYYPGTPDPQGATKLEVPKSGQLNGIDMKLQKTRSFRVTGKVVSSAPGTSKQARVMVQLMPKSQDQSGMWEANRVTQSDSDGKFEFRGVMPGSYELAASSFGRSGDALSRARQEISVAQDNASGVVLKLGTGWELRGSVRVEGDAAPANLNAINFVFADEDSGMMMMSGPPSATPKDDGSVTFKDVGPERYRLRAWNLPEGYYVKSARVGSANMSEGTVDMSTVQGATIEILLSPKGAVAEGMVKNDKDEPVTTGTVVLVPEAAKRSNHELFKQAGLDQYGHYKISGIPPGTYSVYAFQGVEPGIWEDPDYLRTIEKDGVSVKLEESGHETNDLKVIVGSES